MSRDQGSRQVRGAATNADALHAVEQAQAPGKRTLSETIDAHSPAHVQRSAAVRIEPVAGEPRPTLAALFGTPVQRVAEAAPAPGDDAVHAAALRGVATPASALPYRDAIQRSFGRHDVSSVQAHAGGAAAAAAGDMGARAYATGHHVVFGAAPDLHTAAHEAAHVVQQRGGVQLRGGVGQDGDAYERHADAVADRVVRGESSEALLDQMAGGDTQPATSGPVQRKVGIKQLGRVITPGHIDDDKQSWIDHKKGAIKDARPEWVPEDLIADPRFVKLAAARPTYGFESWAEVRSELAHYDENAPHFGFRDRAPPEPEVGVLENIKYLPEEGEPEVGGKGREPWPPKEITPENASDLLLLFNKLFGNCGQTAERLVREIMVHGGQLQLVSQKRFRGMYEAAKLEELLMSPVKRTSLFSVTIHNVHDFTIEKHVDNRCVLHQGYEENYNALWWAGLDEKMVYGLAQMDKKLEQERKRIGAGRWFDFGNLLKLVLGLGNLMRCNTWGDPEMPAKWKELPFLPLDNHVIPKMAKIDTHNEAPIDIEVKVRAIANYDDTVKALKGQPGSFLTNLVMLEVKDLYAQIVEANSKPKGMLPKPAISGGLAGFLKGNLGPSNLKKAAPKDVSVSVSHDKDKDKDKDNQDNRQSK